MSYDLADNERVGLYSVSAQQGHGSGKARGDTDVQSFPGPLRIVISKPTRIFKLPTRTDSQTLQNLMFGKTFKDTLLKLNQTKNKPDTIKRFV